MTVAKSFDDTWHILIGHLFASQRSSLAACAAAGLDDPRQRRSLEVGGAHVLRFMPPITVTTAQIDEAMDIIEAAVKFAERIRDSPNP